jgi:osmotically-inducible protein OsmY
VRDRDDQTLTSGDQGNSPADVDISKRIRREIIGTKDMSVSARNVKIITVNGRVTLRGPVKTEQEKQIIAEIAGRVAQPANVDNQLEVKVSPTGREDSNR